MLKIQANIDKNKISYYPLIIGNDDFSMKIENYELLLCMLDHIENKLRRPYFVEKTDIIKMKARYHYESDFTPENIEKTIQEIEADYDLIVKTSTSQNITAKLTLINCCNKHKINLTIKDME